MTMALESKLFVLQACTTCIFIVFLFIRKLLRVFRSSIVFLFNVFNIITPTIKENFLKC